MILKVILDLICSRIFFRNASESMTCKVFVFIELARHLLGKLRYKIPPKVANGKLDWSEMVCRFHMPQHDLIEIRLIEPREQVAGFVAGGGVHGLV